jgi:hypothetical protein
MAELRASRVGISVHCVMCRQRKAPRGRSAPMIPLCTFECPGYNLAPLVGDLWPGESESDFGYPCSANGTTDAPPVSE